MNSETQSDSDTSSPARTSSLRSPSILILLGLAVLALVIVLIGPGSSDDHSAIGKPAPELDLVQLISASDAEVSADPPEDLITLTGEPVAGKVTVLHFWGTWCPPCLAEYPQLVDMLKQKSSAVNLQFVSVSCESDPSETYPGLRRKTLRYYEEIQAAGLPTYADAEGKTRARVVSTLGNPSMAYPTTLVIGPDQRIAGVWEGYSQASLAQMESLIDQLLSAAG